MVQPCHDEIGHTSFDAVGVSGAGPTRIYVEEELAPVPSSNVAIAASVPISGTKSHTARARESVVQGVDRLCEVYVERPHQCFCGCCWVQLLFAVAFGISIKTGSFVFGGADGAWDVYDSEPSKWHQALKDSREAASGRKDRRLWEEPEPLQIVRASLSLTAAAASPSRSLRRLSDDEEKDVYTNFVYKSSKQPTETVFTPPRLRDMCRIEETLLNYDKYPEAMHGYQDYSLVRLFYGRNTSGYDVPSKRTLGSYDWACETLQQAHVDKTVASMLRDIDENGMKSVYTFFVHASFGQTGIALMSRSVIQMKNKKLEPAMERVFALFDPPLEYGFMKSAYQGDDEDQFLQLGSLRVRFWPEMDTLFDLEMDRMLGDDFMFAFGSVMIVFILMWIHLGSCFLAATGMIQIVLSFPLTALIYTEVFRVKYFEFLHILVVYVVLGIGADDIFVFCDSWKHVTKSLRQGSEPSRSYSKVDMIKALQVAYKRTALAILNTSFTTAMAFLSCSVSKVMPMRTCGWFTATWIVVLYVLTIIWQPACVMVYHLRFEGKRCCCPWPANRLHSPLSTLRISQSGGVGDVDEVGEKPSLVERLLMNVYMPTMKWQVGPVKPVSLVVALALFATSLQGTYFASQLGPPRREEQWWPANHMATDTQDFVLDNFQSAKHSRFVPLSFFWGIEDLDVSEINPYKRDDFTGTVTYDNSFDLATVEAQQAVLRLCGKIRTLMCDHVGCKGDTIMYSSSDKAYSCFLEDFQHWLNTTRNITATLTGDNFLKELRSFRESKKDSQYSSPVLNADFDQNIGFINGQLRFVAVKIRSTMPWVTPVYRGLEVRDMLKEFVKDEIANSPSSMKSLKFSGSGLFAHHSLGEELVNSLFSGCAIAAPVCCIVLIVSTWNIIIASYAVASVGSIVMCVLGFCKSAMDWDLGVGEAVAGIIVIGYSVDYVVHLAHMYCEARNIYGLETREECAEFAIRNMGSTVFAGAMTTMGAGVVMFACFFRFFFKMALLICVTIGFSFLYSLGFFMGLCLIIGPQKDFGRLPRIRSSWLLAKCQRKEKRHSIEIL